MDLQTPSREELMSELASQLRLGITTKTLLGCPTILGLAVVRANAASDDEQDRAVAARELLGQLALKVDGERNGPVATLLGMATATRGSLLKDRRELVAGQLYISPAHLRTSGREGRLMEALADELYAADSGYRRRQRHRLTPEQAAPDSRLGINWLERHQAYRRVWTPLYAMRNDVWVLLKFLREAADGHDTVDRLMNIAWRWAQFQTELARFLADYGGLWLLADVDSEYAAADAIQQAEFLVPLGETDDSWLRLILKGSEQGELDRFIDRMKSEEQGLEVLAVLDTWAKKCPCSLIKPDPDNCPVHRWIAAVDEFTQLINEDWLAVADWYRLDPDNPIGGASIDELWRERPG